MLHCTMIYYVVLCSVCDTFVELCCSVLFCSKRILRSARVEAVKSGKSLVWASKAVWNTDIWCGTLIFGVELRYLVWNSDIWCGTQIFGVHYMPIGK
jgi:hypothetical protein